MPQTALSATEAWTRSVALPTGRLDVRVDHALMPLDALCGFAARRNPKRGFLFVSKVLGKHIPVRARDLADVHDTLAMRIARDLPGPVVFVGMAETAIALGQGVFAAWKRLSGRDDAMFIHTTRYRISAPRAFGFLEEHCHAADHTVYLPEDPVGRAPCEGGPTIVLVDDEASTGKTFVNLAKAFAATRDLASVTTVVLTDWRGPERAAAMKAAMPAPTQMVSLLAGEWAFAPAPDAHLIVMPKATGDGSSHDGAAGRGWGRLGLTDDPVIDATSIDVRPGERLLVLGTGEFAYPPFLLARALEAKGAEVWVQSTTRSPIMPGHAIGDVLSFADNYGDGIANHLYNGRSRRYDRVLVCAETPEGSLDPALLDALAAEAVHMPALQEAR